MLVALYATAGIALVVVGVSVISSGSFRASGSPAGERTAEVKVKASPVPTAVHTPVGHAEADRHAGADARSGGS